MVEHRTDPAPWPADPTLRADAGGTGAADVTEGTPPGVVFVHGMRTSSAIWDRQLEHVRDAGHEAVAVDLPAHGARAGERFTMPRAFEVLDDAARSFTRGTPVVVVGLSLGGYTSLAWAARHTLDVVGAGSHRGPQLAGVVAAGCSADPKGKPVALFRDVARAAVAGTAALRRGASDAALLWRSALTGGSTPAGGADVATLLAASTGRSAAPRPGVPGWDVVTDALTHLAGRSSVANVRAIHAPVWLVNGARDQLRLQESRHLAAANRGALVVVPNAGHDVNSDAPEAFNQVLTRALRDFAR